MLWADTRKELAWLMELPGKPRTPSICDLGLAWSPMQEMLAWPKRSICTGPTRAWRLPLQTLSKMREKPIQLSNFGW
ncbi:hypothetical protein D3C78_1255650 [compost metagenome]